MAVTINGSTGITTPGITNSGNETVSGNSAVTGIISTGGNSLSPVQSFRNKIINGNFDFWQRGTSFTSSGYGGPDRWLTLITGSTHTTSRQSFTLGHTDVPGEPTYYQRTVVTSSAGAGNLCLTYQKIESVRTLAGQKATLSFWAKADASKNMAVEFTQEFGSGGSPSSSITGIGVTTCALTTSWQKFEIIIDVPSISGKTLGSNGNDCLQIVFWFDAGSDWNSRTNSLGQQSGTFDIAQVQFEAGSVATPFEVRPPGVELGLCQRYYQLIAWGLENYANGGYTRSLQTITFTVMRAVPTVTRITTGVGQSNIRNSDPSTYAYINGLSNYCASISVESQAQGLVQSYTNIDSLSAEL